MEQRSKTVWIDMDGTMFDFDGAALKAVPEKLRVPRGDFYVARDYPEHIQRTIKDTYNSPEFFENLEIFDGVKEGWQAIIDSGRHPRVLSAPLSSNPTSIEGKVESLKRHLVPEFGEGVIKEAVFDKNKWKYGGLALIDDRPEVPRGENGQNSATWEHILYGWPHIMDGSLARASFRLLSWDDTDSLIDALDAIDSLKLRTHQ